MSDERVGREEEGSSAKYPQPVKGSGVVPVVVPGQALSDLAGGPIPTEWLHRVVVAGLRATIVAHGPITREGSNIGSAAKLIVCQITKGDKPKPQTQERDMSYSDDSVEVVAALVRTEYLRALSSGAGHISSDLVADMVRHAMGRDDLTMTAQFSELREAAGR